MKPVAWQNGSLMAMDDALIPIHSPGVLSARAVFDGCRVFARQANGNDTAFVLDIAGHVDRLRHSCEALEISLPYSPYELVQAAASVVSASKPKEDAGLRWFVTEVNRSDDGLLMPLVAIFIRSLKGYTKPEPYRLNFARRTRWSGYGIPYYAKTMSHYASSKTDTQFAVESGFNDCLFLNQYGHITETPRANILLLKPDTICSPVVGDGILPGITKNSLKKLISQGKLMKWVEKSIGVYELGSFSGALMLSSSLGVVPISQIGPFHYETASSLMICELWSSATSPLHSFFPSLIDEFKF